MAKGTLVWHGKELVETVQHLMLDDIDKIALEVIVESDPPIDTGFLDASAYVNSATGLNTFDQVWANGKFIGRKRKSLVERRSVESPHPPPPNGATVGWSAQYSVYVEEQTHFIYAALLRVQANNT